MDGALNIHKPAGMTSHDVVAITRRLAGTRRIGHGGTLDPNTTGVLVLGLGVGTRLLEYLKPLEKTYRAEVRFGLTTSTQDIWGETVERSDARGLTREAVEEALGRFRGEIEQVPPMVSAVSVGGERLYKLARRGETVERAPRPVTVTELALEDFTSGEEPTSTLLVRCSGGTYIRTLVHDLGQALGCGAAMSGLVRLAVGPFRLEEAAPFDELRAEPDKLNKWLLPVGALVTHLPAVELTEEERLAVGFGRAVPAGADQIPGELVRLLGPGGELLGLARVAEGEGGLILAPKKMLVTSDAAHSRS